MEDIFVFDSVTNSIRINNYPILLVKEFADLWDQERNKCKDDPSGIKRIKAYREFTYIFLCLDWKSPYFQYLEQEKAAAAKIDAGLSDEDMNDEKFKAAFNKYKEIINSDRILSLIRTALHTLTKTEIFLDNIDFANDVDESGRPIYRPSDVMKDLTQIKNLRRDLMELEIEHKKGIVSKNKTRGDVEIGFMEE